MECSGFINDISHKDNAATNALSVKLNAKYRLNYVIICAILVSQNWYSLYGARICDSPLRISKG